MSKIHRLSAALSKELSSTHENVPMYEKFDELHDADSQEAFLLKLLLNSLVNFNETYSEYALLNRLINEPLLDGPWFDAARAHIGEEKDGPIYAVSALRKMVGRAEVKQMVQEIRLANPALNGKLRPRETALTLGDLLDLNELEIAILDTACRLPNAPYNIRCNLDGMDLRFSNPTQMIASLYSVTNKQAQAALKGVLFNAGIVSKENSCVYGLWGLNGDFTEIFNEPHITLDQIDKAVFPHMLETDLKVADYPHLTKEIDRVVDIIKKNQKKGKRERGVNVMFWGLAGTGKCLDPNEPVMKYSGEIVISKDLVVGDRLMGPDSHARTVLSTSWGRGQMYEVVPTKGSTWKCNGDHILSLRRSSGGDKDQIIFVTVDDWLGWSTSKKSQWKLWRAAVDFPKLQEPEIDPYFIGILLGDGSIGHKISIHSVDPEVIEEVYTQASKWGMQVHEWVQPNKIIEYGLVAGEPAGGKTSDLREALRRNKMMRTCGEKAIPYAYKLGSRQVRQQVLAGLIDTDGSYDGGGFDFISKSKVLADDVAFVARSLGLAAYVKTCHKSSQNGTAGKYYRVYLSGDLMMIPTRIARKKANARKQIKNVLNVGFGIRALGEGDYFGITLDGDHQYLLGDFTVTHNTELAIAAAKEHGWNLKVIGDVSRENMEENGRENRLASLKLATKIFRNQPNTVLLFDEMEDLFKTDTKAAFSKAFINRIIETTEIPIIWTTNNLQLLGQPVLRRMVYNISFQTPPEETRLEIWTKYAAQYKLKVDPDALKEVAKLYAVVPAVIKNAVHVASTAMGRKKVDKENLLEIVGSLDTLVNYGVEKKVKTDAIKIDDKYDVTCVNSDVPLEGFTKKVVSAKDPGFAICLYGAPGTGKSEYGRHLAKEMGKEVLFKRASDLQSMWVGVCEKNIAEAFEEAKKKKMVLIIDEGDSFLRDRNKALASWEISQVNEMLSQMETHTEPFILTTNLMKDLDAASLRRFTFKMEFRYMKTDQARRLFKSFFGVEAPAEMDRNTMLVPGDFANVRKQVRILGIKSAVEIYRLVEEETKLKPGKRESIGFNR